MIRVLHVLDELRSSGAEVALRHAGPLWEEFGVSCDVLATGADVGPYAEQLLTAGYGVHHIPFSRDPRFLSSLATYLRSQRYDVVHVQLERAFVYISLIAVATGSRVVRTVRSCYPFEGRLARRRSLQRAFARTIGTTFVAISESVARNESERFHNPTTQVDNWIDVERFKPPTDEQRSQARLTLEVPDEAFAIATVGNCSVAKNHRALIAALARMESRDWIWLHVGSEDGDSGERQLVQELGVADRCRFLGRSDPLDALHAADTYAMPSLWEGLGMATVEAMSTGLSTVLTRVAGSRDLEALSRRIAWADPDPESLAVALEQSMRDAESQDRAEDRIMQVEAVAARYSPKHGVARYAAMYRG